ncbi:hypothetical protein AN640_02985 [Candidatus Epulonipiscium fishelsonii]|uniref:Uncharacterized protein n=1 Tax=Candidatus Epulonipiscium fishelsonii TaxID=77094 RepID=A0ACC8X837_9FIRM|nr:hypothetical protein AN640_02985 [Epulopiscium sp. SCG-D08WGA-EpuloA1]
MLVVNKYYYTIKKAALLVKATLAIDHVLHYYELQLYASKMRCTNYTNVYKYAFVSNTKYIVQHLLVGRNILGYFASCILLDMGIYFNS